MAVTCVTLFSFKLSSIAWREEISGGISAIEFLERSKRANWVNPLLQKAVGKVDRWFDARWTSL